MILQLSPINDSMPHSSLLFPSDSVEQNASTFSTSGLDGRVVVWKLKDLELSLNLKDLSL